ncbi:MAG: glycoside hydrolase family 2 protein [Lachnospiraceae bacterium]|nr:glycoside hydrolase family 2 protein [Lachnospiraceae bacterium]
MSKKIWLNDNWQFTEKYSEELNQKDYRGECASVSIPHSVKETPFHYFDESVYQMVGGYRRVIRAEKEWEGKRVFIGFMAVAHSAVVYLNGRQVAEHHCGYTAFEAEITDALRYGEDNILVVRADSRETQNIPPFGNVIDYMTYGGIYREVFLEITDAVKIRNLHLRPEAPEGVGKPQEIKGHRFRGTLILETELDAGDSSMEGLDVNIRIREHRSGRNVLERTMPYAEVLKLDIEEARLWDVSFPFLYDLSFKLLRNGKELDSAEDCFGFRRSEFRADGYYLNGRKLRIRGLNRHQSYAYVGYAMPASMQRLDAEILRLELGVNAVRTSHYPQSQHFIRRCDELGLLVFTEIPGWQYVGDAEWKEQVIRNTEEMITQYRNHPSIILWGVRINESGDDDPLYEKTNALAHALDADRPTGGVRFLKKSSLLEDVYTYNDFSHDGTNRGCDRKESITPDMAKPFLITEYAGHMFPTKSYDCEQHRLEHALRHAAVVNAVRAETDIAGSFGWCMFDYNTHKDFGSGDRICYHGVTDMFRNPKLAAYLYASQQDRTPVLEISSTMDIGDFPGGTRGAIYIFSNADRVRMYRNDELLKEYEGGDPKYGALKHPPILIDDFVGDGLEKEEGLREPQISLVKLTIRLMTQYGVNHVPERIERKLKRALARFGMKWEDAIALHGKYVSNWGGRSVSFRFEAIKDGKVVCTRVRSTSSRLSLDVRVDHTELVEEATYDVAAVRLRVCDEYGNVAPYFQTPLPLQASGPIRIIGPQAAFMAGGMGGTYIKTTGEAGEASLCVSLPEGWDFQGKTQEVVRFTIRKA